jgi:hypothetical protein
MHKYQSHKIVEAARVTEFNPLPEEGYLAVFEDGTDQQLGPATAERILTMANDSKTTVNGGWIMFYPDGYVSWSPHGVFDEGYDLVQPSSGKSEIVGYRELTELELVEMNNVKEHGKQLGQVVEYMRTQDFDQRWVSVGATHLQQGLMCLTRAVTKPEFF